MWQNAFDRSVKITRMCFYFRQAPLSNLLYINKNGLASKRLLKIDAKWPNSWSFIVDSYTFDNVVKTLTGL